MRFLTFVSAASAGFSLLDTAAARPADTHVVHEKRDGASLGWMKTGRADANTPIHLRIALAQQNLHRADEFMYEVAHPDSALYGRHWSPQKVVETFAPSENAVLETVDWLLDAGVESKRISQSASRNWIKIKTTAAEAESLLHTTYNVYENDDGLELVACESYSLPTDIQKHIDLVAPTIQFDERGATVRQRGIKRRDAIPPKSRKLPPWAHGHGRQNSLVNCSSITTPACLRAMYDIPKHGEAVKGNSYGIVEIAPQSYNQTDLNGFYSTYTNIPNDTSPIINGIDGGYLSSDEGVDTRGESNLDLCYAIGLVYPQNVTLYQVGDAVLWQPATYNNFLDAIDGSYCSFEGGDDPTWDTIYPHDNTTVGAYTGEPMCGTYNATNVISVSYGRVENARPASYNARECAEYMKLGLMGVTVMYSSGDTGVAGIQDRCLNPDGSWTPVGAGYGGFSPLFPASCPWITSVGGSALPPNGTVQDRETVAWDFPPGGGFSNNFEMPSYQAAAVKSWFADHPTTYNSSQFNNTQKARGFPDVAVASQNFVTGLDGGFQAFSGTSAAAPTFGSMITLVNGERIKAGKGPVGFVNPVLYEHPEIFDDIVEGNNPGCGTPGFSAVEGWDPASGLGAPNYQRLLKVLLSLP